MGILIKPNWIAVRTTATTKIEASEAPFAIWEKKKKKELDI